MSDYADRVRIVPQFTSDDGDAITGILFGRLDSRLSRWSPEQVEMEISVKERDTPSQRVVLECWISGMPKLVATSTEQQIETAIAEVRDELWSQLDKQISKQEDQRRR
ncbi:HPF/RaiA family ribosome-associated protein [Hoyosella sp. G463]|uniref:HPF/RaiA family ribosome-associated protein n=1 Tax=Lolliginicoccus lacisalsi TaxID=2742202 RepID=A0A927JA98_9ACTN|nr:HPF/RaiA family ribosome-associated protein [Lolliginicoccus lacisalsi]MBD8505200.1 HPF/RaiA family ribosome-associated protein [Lolliginicoccus lacisalsi]